MEVFSFFAKGIRTTNFLILESSVKKKMKRRKGEKVKYEAKISLISEPLIIHIYIYIYKHKHSCMYILTPFLWWGWCFFFHSYAVHRLLPFLFFAFLVFHFLLVGWHCSNSFFLCFRRCFFLPSEEHRPNQQRHQRPKRNKVQYWKYIKLKRCPFRIWILTITWRLRGGRLFRRCIFLSLPCCIGVGGTFETKWGDHSSVCVGYMVFNL